MSDRRLRLLQLRAADDVQRLSRLWLNRLLLLLLLLYRLFLLFLLLRRWLLLLL